MVEFLRGQWKDLTNMIDPFSIMLMEGFFVVPLVMAALFYPLQVLIGVSRCCSWASRSSRRSSGCGTIRITRSAANPRRAGTYRSDLK